MTENLLLTVLTAALCENFVFSHLLGAEAALSGEDKPIRTLLRGMLTMICMMAASVLAFAVDKLVLEKSGTEYLGLLVYALLLAGLELAAETAASKLFQRYNKISPRYIILNSAVYAVVLQTAECGGWYEAFLHGAVSGIGFTLAALLVSCIRERLETADIPESFRNLPILILAAGICAMIFTGFAGLSF